MNSPNIKTVGFVIRFLSFSLVLCMLIPFLQDFATPPDKLYSTVISERDRNPITVIIDPGHGGIDSGAVGENGVLEKDLNLKISLILCALLEANGINAELTRTTDKMLDLEDPTLSGTHKLRDLKNRLAIAEQYPKAVFISIHMNKFAQSRYSGLQVWYSKNNADSAALATELQNRVKQVLLPDNNRKCKAADSSIFLLDRAVGTAVLVECGFLSNPEEAAALASDEYQKQLASVIFAVISEHLEQKNTAPDIDAVDIK
jgi:N-acetylmuramoyl-L-alanine amidase